MTEANIEYVYPTYSARDFVNRDTEELFRTLPEEDFYLEFDDGRVLTDERALIYSHFIWQYHREFPNTPLLLKHHVTAFSNNREIRHNTHIAMINSVFWDVFEQYREGDSNAYDLLNRLSQMYFEVSNEMYNKLSVWLTKYRPSLNILHFIEFTTAEDIEKQLLAFPPTEEGIHATNAYVMKTLREDPRFKHNPLAIAVRTGISREGQTTQILGRRGFLTDIDNDIFKFPIMMGYVLGIRKLYDSFIESRSASKHLISSDKPLKDSEYFSRRQQLICSNVRDLHFGDCGSENYIVWRVRGDRVEGDGTKLKSDLITLAGKYYLDEDTGKLKVLKSTDKHLIGKTIKVRDPVAGCKHPNPYGVCMTCVGEVGFSLPKNANLGHSFCVSVMSVLGQLILSTKHYEGSSSIVKISIPPMERDYLRADPSGNAYLFNEKLKSKKKVCLYVPIQNASGLADVRTVPDVRSLNLKMTSEFQRIRVKLDDGNVVTEQVLDVYVNSRYSSFSHEMLEYIKKYGYTTMEDGTYEINLEHWDYSQVALNLPFSHFNMSDHQTAIARCLESVKDKTEKRIRYISPEDKLIELHDLVNREITVNLSVLGIVLYASMIVDGPAGNYDLPKAWTPRHHGSLRAIMMSRSLAATMAFQGHKQTFFNPASFVNTNRLNHPFDGVIMPEIYNSDPDGALTTN